MSDAPEITALEALEALEKGLGHATKSIQWQVASHSMVIVGDAPQAMRSRAIAFAVEHDEAARVELNKVRVFLGGEPEPDPAEPPPIQPDDRV
jgi:hypothetical protein